MRRAGFTLLEVVLVFAVMLIAGALALPSIDAMMAQGRVSAARDMVRGAWAEMRAKAMDEGRPYRFAVTDGTGRFRIAPDDQAYWQGGDPGRADDKPLIIENELPPGILFAKEDSALMGLGEEPTGGQEYGNVVAVYLADGTARDDAEILFGKAGQRGVGLRLRALTGAVTAIEAAKVEDAQP